MGGGEDAAKKCIGEHLCRRTRKVEPCARTLEFPLLVRSDDFLLILFFPSSRFFGVFRGHFGLLEHWHIVELFKCLRYPLSTRLKWGHGRAKPGPFSERDSQHPAAARTSERRQPI